jgi:replication factor A1
MYSKEIKSIQKQFADVNIKVKPKDIETRLTKLVEEFHVPMDESIRSVINFFQKQTGTKLQFDNKIINLSDIENKQWCSLKIKVTKLWDSNHDSISQVGLIGDPTNAIKFTSWTNAKMPEVEEGKSYIFKNVVVNEYNDRLQINLNKTSSIEELSEDIEAGSTEITIAGALVGIQIGSGLIKRCPECNRALIKGGCSEHGKVEGVYDIRIKGVLDDGATATNILFDRKMTEQITGRTLDECIDMASTALDNEIVVEVFRRALIGRYFTVTGPNFDSLLVKMIIPIEAAEPVLTNQLKEIAKEMM